MFFLDRKRVSRKNRKRVNLVPLYWAMLIGALIVGFSMLIGLGWLVLYIIQICLIYL